MGWARCHQGQRHTFNLKHGAPRKLDYIAIPKTWLAATTKSVVLEHFDAYTIIYDNKPVAVEIKGSLMSCKVLATIPRLYKRWIQSRVKEDLGQALHHSEMQQVPHWSLDQHEHRHEFTKIIHEATEGVAATKVKPRKPYVTDAVLEVFIHRTRFIKSISREGKYAKHLDQRRVLRAWKEISHWIAGHRRPTHEPLESLGEFKASICQGYTRYEIL